MFRLILALFLLFAFSTEVLAQRGGGGGGGPRGAGGRQRPGQQPQPESQPDQPESQAEPPSEPQSESQSGPPPEASPESQPPPPPSGRPGGRGGQVAGEAATTSGQGTVPQLAPSADQFVPLMVIDPLQTGTIVPSDIPYKVVRYASRIMEKYDLNGNGFLEREEWSKMPGSPQSIDMDGDFIISLDEMIRFIAYYGSVRTIHRPNPPPILASSDWDMGNVSVFKPFSAAAKQKTAPSEPQDVIDPAAEIDGNRIVGGTDSEPGEISDHSGEESSSEQGELDDLSYEKVFAGQFRPSERMYHVPLNELRGVPYWFIQRDKNGDGQLSMLEFDPTLSPEGLAAFGRLDKNGDGFLTPDEVRVEQ